MSLFTNVEPLELRADAAVIVGFAVLGQSICRRSSLERAWTHSDSSATVSTRRTGTTQGMTCQLGVVSLESHKGKGLIKSSSQLCCPSTHVFLGSCSFVYSFLVGLRRSSEGHSQLGWYMRLPVAVMTRLKPSFFRVTGAADEELCPSAVSI